MIDNAPFPQRKSPRKKGYDYSQEGVYFVTVCTHRRQYLFGDVVNGEMVLSNIGEIAHQEIEKIPEYWAGLVDIDLYVVMPNHIHAIVILVGTAFLPSGVENIPPTSLQKMDTQKRAPTLGNVVGNHKSGVTRLARRMGCVDGYSRIWQRSYHDHIIRNETSLNKLREYTLYNPTLWADDTFYSAT